MNGSPRIANLVSFIDQLMRSRNQLEAVDVVELVGHLVAKQPAGTARADSPSVDIFGVGPHEIAESTLMRNLLSAGDDSNLVNGPDLRAQTTVHAEHLAVDNGGQDQKVEYLAARFPDRRVAVLLLAFFVEAVDLGDLPRLVVAANENDSVRIPMSLSADGQPGVH